jgi:hypothetical protein
LLSQKCNLYRYSEVELTVVKTNAPAIALYGRQGYAMDEGGGGAAVGGLCTS